MDLSLQVILSSGAVSVFATLVTLAISFGKYKEKIESNEKRIEKYETKLSDMAERISKLEGGIDRDRQFIKSQSPLSLTEKGKEALQESHGKNYVDHNITTLLEAIKNKSPKTAYDVQEIAQEIIKKHKNDDAFIPIKNYVFNKGLDLNLLVNILSIYLRDIALKALGFNISDIKD